MTAHVRSCGKELPTKTNSQALVPIPKKVQKKKLRHTICPICNKVLLHKNLKRHSAEVHEMPYINHASVCVDSVNGIFMVNKQSAGVPYLIHIKALVGSANQQLFCENTSCAELTRVAARGGQKQFQCSHLRSVLLAEPFPEVPELSPNSLQALIAGKVMSRDSQAACQALANKARQCGKPLIVPWCAPGEHGKIWFSVFEPQVKYWSRLGRTVVSYSFDTGIFSCKCSNRHGCPHKLAAKWYLAQVMPEALKSVDDSAQANQVEQEDASLALQEGKDDASADQQSSSKSHMEAPYPPVDTHLLAAMVEYISTKKKIPFPWPLQDHAVFPKITPNETICYICKIPLGPEEKVTDSAKIICLDSVTEGMEMHIS